MCPEEERARLNADPRGERTVDVDGGFLARRPSWRAARNTTRLPEERQPQTGDEGSLRWPVGEILRAPATKGSLPEEYQFLLPAAGEALVQNSE